MKRRDLIRHLADHGVGLLREGGPRVPVPRGGELDDYTAKGICRQLGIPPP